MRQEVQKHCIFILIEVGSIAIFRFFALHSITIYWHLLYTANVFALVRISLHDVDDQEDFPNDENVMPWGL